MTECPAHLWGEEGKDVDGSTKRKGATGDDRGIGHPHHHHHPHHKHCIPGEGPERGKGAMVRGQGPQQLHGCEVMGRKGEVEKYKHSGSGEMGTASRKSGGNGDERGREGGGRS